MTWIVLIGAVDHGRGAGMSVHPVAELDAVAAELNDRPRKRLAFAKPVEKLGPLLLR